MSLELLRLICAQIFLHSTLAGNRMAAPLLALREGYSPAAIGMLLALFGLAQVILAIPVGRYADQHGLKRPIVFAVMAACLGGALAAMWPVFGVLCVTAFLTGGAAGAAVITVQRQVGRLSEGGAQLRRSFSWLAIGPSVSNLGGALAVGFLIDHAGPSPGSVQGFQAAFALMAVVPLVTWLLLRPVREVLGDKPVGERPSAWRAWQLLREPGVARLMMVNWFVSSSWDVHSLVVPLLGVERGLSASQIGMILGSFAVATGLVRLLLPLLADRIREWAVMVTAMISAGLLFAVYPLLPSALAMGACSFCMGMVLGVVQPMVMSILHQVTPPERHGEALGLRLMAVTATGVAVPLLLGTVSSLIGLSGVLWMVAAVVASGSRVAWGLRSVRDSKHTEADGPGSQSR
ncbi:MAG: MFS transporter [Betaproteobacteria bacterium]